jgi:hypothetical protein
MERSEIRETLRVDAKPRIALRSIRATSDVEISGGQPMPSVVITGTSTGIGWGTAKVQLDRGFRVFGSVRKQEDADRLKGR